MDGWMESAPLTIKLFVMSFLLAGQPGRHGDRGVVIAQPSKEQANGCIIFSVNLFYAGTGPSTIQNLFSIHRFIDYFLYTFI